MFRAVMISLALLQERRTTLPWWQRMTGAARGRFGPFPICLIRYRYDRDVTDCDFGNEV
jgi:hypothetical protein